MSIAFKRIVLFVYSMPDDILVLEKDNGTVQRIVNGKMLPEPVLDVNVATT